MSSDDKAAATEQRLNRHFTTDLHLPPPGSWIDTGALTGGWGKGTGFFRYRYLTQGVVGFAAIGLTPGTVSDGTTILTNANGLQAGFRPSVAQQWPATTNFLKTSPVGAGASFEPGWLEFQTGGGVQCFGFGLSATFCNCIGYLFTDL